MTALLRTQGEVLLLPGSCFNDRSEVNKGPFVPFRPPSLPLPVAREVPCLSVSPDTLKLHRNLRGAERASQCQGTRGPLEWERPAFSCVVPIFPLDLYYCFIKPFIPRALSFHISVFPSVSLVLWGFFEIKKNRQVCN